ncbi:MAG: hypothetical protein ABIJ42_10080 [Acidobacteriota bacterium]
MKKSFKPLLRIGFLCVIPLLLASCGAVREKAKVQAPETYLQAKVATEAELMELINTSYADIDSIAVSRFSVEFTGGSLEDGYFEKYRKADGYLVAKRPDSIFVNILNPLTKSSVLTMASSESMFQIWIPSKNQYVIGPSEIERDVDNPVYNARPSHFVQGIMMETIELDNTGLNYYIEEEDDGVFRYYVLVVLRRASGSSRLTLHRKIWIERSSLQVRRQQYFQDSRLVSNIGYGPSVQIGNRLVPTTVRINRPLDRYSINFEIETDSVRLNRELKAGVFIVPKPPGAELIRVEEENPEADN